MHAAGHSLKLLIREGKHSPVPIGKRIIEVPGALENQAALNELANDVEVLVHCAATVRGADWQDFYQPNVAGTKRLLQAVENSHIEQVILISSLAAREPQLSWYAKSKYQAEQVCRQLSNRICCSIIRPPAIYGPGDKEMLPLLRMLYRGWALRITATDQRLSLVHISDLTSAVIALLNSPSAGVFEPDDGELDNYNWDKLCRIMQQYSGRTIRTLPLPELLLKRIAWLNLQIAKLTGHQPILTPGKARELRWSDWTTDSQALTDATDWTPQTRLIEGLRGLPLD